MHLEVLVHHLNGFFVSLARHNTTDSRQQCSCCQRSATMFAVFLLCTAVLNCVRATHGLPADRAPVYCGCPCRDPVGCPLMPTDTQAGWYQGQSANPLAAALLLQLLKGNKGKGKKGTKSKKMKRKKRKKGGKQEKKETRKKGKTGKKGDKKRKKHFKKEKEKEQTSKHVSLQLS